MFHPQPGWNIKSIITKRILFFLLAFSMAGTARSQQFPESFIGNWEGELRWYQPGKAEPQKVKMQLVIQPVDSGCYTWQLIYGEASGDNRPYILKPADLSKGHWIVDELNGIRLDQYWIGQRFTNTFTVQNTTIINNYWIEGDSLIAEFYSFTSKPVTVSGGGTIEVPEVSSFGIKAFQKAILKRRK